MSETMEGIDMNLTGQTELPERATNTAFALLRELVTGDAATARMHYKNQWYDGLSDPSLPPQAVISYSRKQFNLLLEALKSAPVGPVDITQG